MKQKRKFSCKLKLCNAMLLFLFGTMGVIAQTVTGTVTSNDGPLPGASVTKRELQMGQLPILTGCMKLP